MTWREQIVCSILLLVAQFLAEDATVATEIKNLRTRISVKTTTEAK